MLKLQTVDASLAIDYPEADGHVGPVRRAKKVLADGIWLLARSYTYAAGLADLAVAGCSAGINAERSEPAETDFMQEEAGNHRMWIPSRGVTAIEPLPNSDCGDVFAARIIAKVAGACDLPLVFDDAFQGHRVLDSLGGVELVARGSAPSDAVFVSAGGMGVINHHEPVGTNAVIEFGMPQVTPRQLAERDRNNALTVPSFVTTAAWLIGVVITEDLREPTFQRLEELVGATTNDARGNSLLWHRMAEANLLARFGTLPSFRPMPA